MTTLNSRDMLHMAAQNEQLQTLTGLQFFLTDHQIPWQQWGTGAAKRVEDLQKEIQESESILAISNGELARIVHIALVDVTYQDPQSNRLYRLVQRRQVFADGRVREQNLDVSISEKLKTEELKDYDFESAAHRGVMEELGILITPEDLGPGVQNISERDSQSYPGLKAQYVSVIFPLALNTEQFRPEGYIEVQEDKTTHFEWIEM